MRKLIEQVAKFGVVGIIAFLIDIGVMNILLHLHLNNLLASTASFLISLAFNYLASMKYVFTHRDDMARWMEIVVFFVSAAIGLGINEVIIWAGTSMLPADAAVSMHAKYVLYTNASKIVSTVVVAIWNFIIRKWLLDAPAPGKPKNERSFARRLGAFSLAHRPFGWQ
ncbi:GtrA-like domain protein [Bifidobacterium actinocoloniiforme DSM 22766]|uniref:GtrA-like domain protein n=1 Tax=Bifidobacterium actinocoloniiforme DSM 22766 TaxID=1437605 RepID=A0A086Z1W7_9BIFI|nr:GtrA family protein [Bifidobacterium actinocoloniiforme]AKV55615.1 sugar translocase [Bifidobacterium actinocoloniiforme DSM 22766]KFI40517.1 GtrA-like domain protein [Bifidobacterium actinocoloniiforme DSM 22766]